ncbi:Cdc2- kinase [Blyttiomyces sp. JEL0837]|nr:Cdc2- kinase [Blyttiomyces sp. JEL0837]
MSTASSQIPTRKASDPPTPIRPRKHIRSFTLSNAVPLPHPFYGACRDVDGFEKVKRVGEGTYGVVYQAKDKSNGEVVALKKIRMEQEQEGMPLSSLREIAILKSLRHQNIVKVLDVVVGKDFADFGLARKFGQPARPMTPRVVTLWYRAPEVLLGTKCYTHAIDMWAVGCIFGELLKNGPLLPGKSERHQMELICNLLGAPTDRIWSDHAALPLSSLFRVVFEKAPKYSQVKQMLNAQQASEQAIELLLDMMVYNPNRRLDAYGALRHAYFRREGPNPCDPGMIRMSAVRPRYGSSVDSQNVARAVRRKMEGEHEEERKRWKQQQDDLELNLGAQPFKKYEIGEPEEEL